MEREKIITAVIVVCFFGGLVGGPIASLADYHGSPEERFRHFIIPEIIGFISAGFLVYYGKLCCSKIHEMIEERALLTIK